MSKSGSLHRQSNTTDFSEDPLLKKMIYQYNVSSRQAIIIVQALKTIGYDETKRQQFVEKRIGAIKALLLIVWMLMIISFTSIFYYILCETT